MAQAHVQGSGSNTWNNVSGAQTVTMPGNFTSLLSTRFLRSVSRIFTRSTSQGITVSGTQNLTPRANNASGTTHDRLLVID